MLNILIDVLLESAEKFPDSVALVFRTRQLTYSQLLTEVKQYAGALHAHGVRAGQSVGISLPRSIDYLVSYFAVTYLGAVIVPIDPRLTSIEAIAILEFCDVGYLITNQGAMKHNSLKVLMFDAFPGTSTSVLPYHASPASLAILLQTSGTTDEPKRVMLSHNNLIQNLKAHSESLELTRLDRVLIALPMYFGYCNTAQILTHLALGGTLVIMPEGFSAKYFAQLVEAERITTFTAVPTMLHFIAAYRHLQQFDLSSLRYIIYGGGAMPRKLLEDLSQKLPDTELVQTYGQTEASPRITTMRHSPRNPNSVGKPIKGVTVHIRDEAGMILPSNAEGEVTVMGPNIMLGYYKNLVLTERAVRDGVLYTGDIGYFDSDGFLYLSGRKENMIIRAGTNIYVEEIEKFLIQHPDVEAVCVVGEAHLIQGEVPIAYVVQHASLTEQVLLKYAEKGLAPYKIPARIVFCDQLPYTYNHKPQRFKLTMGSR